MITRSGVRTWIARVVPAILEGALRYGGARWTIARSALATRILAERFTTV